MQLKNHIKYSNGNFSHGFLLIAIKNKKERLLIYIHQ